MKKIIYFLFCFIMLGNAADKNLFPYILEFDYGYGKILVNCSLGEKSSINLNGEKISFTLLKKNSYPNMQESKITDQHFEADIGNFIGEDHKPDENNTQESKITDQYSEADIDNFIDKAYELDNKNQSIENLLKVICGSGKNFINLCTAIGEYQNMNDLADLTIKAEEIFKQINIFFIQGLEYDRRNDKDLINQIILWYGRLFQTEKDNKNLKYCFLYSYIAQNFHLAQSTKNYNMYKKLIQDNIRS